MAFPKISSRGRHEIEQAVITKTKHLTLIYIPIIIAYILFAPLFFQVLFPQYLDAVLPSQILALGVVFQSRALVDIFLFSHGTVTDRYRITLGSQIIRIFLYTVCIPYYGLYGAIAANVISEMCSAAVMTYVYLKSRKV
jgi:O-antigen/teichoic acid export membrane protein